MTGRICEYIQRQPVILYGNIRRKFLGAVQLFGSDTLVVAELVKRLPAYGNRVCRTMVGEPEPSG